MQFSVRAQRGFKNSLPKLKFMLTTLKMIHTYVYNKGLKQKLRRKRERRKKFETYPHESSDTAERGDDPENSVQRCSKPCLDDDSPRI